MSLAIEKLADEFISLTTQEKIEFLKKVIAGPPGEWIELDGKLYFIPEGPPATKEEEETFKKSQLEIETGQGVPLNELRKRLEI
ncbi:MAG: hypothetical protein IMW95_01205 [Moorella humiferrea]|uniref:Uncharacterized protein n=1 Tax=Neomoorella humiferrea TaxID=676965 RepID=A0A2T0ARJ7_9FIRM|nr:hypothetical protein [Moorella humiferrea]MBE3571557.1 hypothetical protein [Moorella humiferrea]PRR72439.1 hypothetical protein MOHU_13640 [Moorella humiferrea]